MVAIFMYKVVSANVCVEWLAFLPQYVVGRSWNFSFIYFFFLIRSTIGYWFEQCVNLFRSILEKFVNYVELLCCLTLTTKPRFIHSAKSICCGFEILRSSIRKMNTITYQFVWKCFMPIAFTLNIKRRIFATNFHVLNSTESTYSFHFCANFARNIWSYRTDFHLLYLTILAYAMRSQNSRVFIDRKLSLMKHVSVLKQRSSNRI